MPLSIINSTFKRALRGMSLSIILGFNVSVCTAEPLLEIDNGRQVQQFTSRALLAHRAVRTIDVPADVAYHRAMHYQALPLAALLPQLDQADTLQFTATDGFVANISAASFTAEAQPWLAIEPADRPWPVLKPGSGSAGPFYLVWLTPKENGIPSDISPDQWPYQIAKISMVSALEKRYPQLLPQPVLAATHPVSRGMRVFAANCATCHKLNGGGDSIVGPDLNLPFSPTEYMEAPFLRKLIRDPAGVRNWPQRMMPAFSEAVLSNAQLDDLLAYLRQMAEQRK